MIPLHIVNCLTKKHFIQMITPQISVIVPVYNMERYLKDCVDSILAQTFSDFELLLVDNGSTDKSLDICTAYAEKDNRVKVFCEYYSGVSNARNKGIEESTGNYILFVDSDDWLERDCLEQLMLHIGHYDILFYGFSWVYADGSRHCCTIGEYYADDRNGMERCMLRLKENDMHENIFGFTVNKLFKADIIRDKAIRFLCDVQYGEDEIFTLEYCIFASSLAVIPTSLYCYRQRASSLIHQKDTAESVLSKFFVVDSVLDRISLPALKKVWAKYAYHALQDAAKRSGSIRSFIHYYIESLKYKAKYKDMFVR